MTRTPGQRRYARGPDGRLQAFETIAQWLGQNPKVRPEMRAQLTAKKVQSHYDRLLKDYQTFVEHEKRASGRHVTRTERQLRIFPLIEEALNYQNEGASRRGRSDVPCDRPINNMN